MSIKMMHWVRDHAEVEGTDLLVLLYLADCARDDNGLQAWPSIARLCQWTRRSETVVRRSLRHLELLGYLISEARAGRSNIYRLLTPVVDAGGTPSVDDRSDGRGRLNGQSSTHLTPVVDDSSDGRVRLTPSVGDPPPPPSTTPRTVIETSLYSPSVVTSPGEGVETSTTPPFPTIAEQRLTSLSVTDFTDWHAAWVRVHHHNDTEPGVPYPPGDHLDGYLFDCRAKGYPPAAWRWEGFYRKRRLHESEAFAAQQRVVQAREDWDEFEMRSNNMKPRAWGLPTEEPLP